MLCNVTGTVYTAQGDVLELGKLYITLQQDMVLDGLKIVPTRLTVDLALTTGTVDIDLYPTVGASPSGLSYIVEFDPDPDDTSKPIRTKVGYWSNFWSVPYQASVALSSFTSALRGSPSANYLPVGSPAVGIHPATELITSGNKVLTAAEDGKALFIDTTTARSVTLPTPTAGMRFVIQTEQLAGTGNHSLVVGSGITIYGWGTSKTNGAFSQSGSAAAGDWVEVIGIDATTWRVLGNRGPAWV